jgi:hypothetical protein
VVRKNPKSPTGNLRSFGSQQTGTPKNTGGDRVYPWVFISKAKAARLKGVPG